MIKIAKKKDMDFYAHQMWILIVLALLIGGLVGYVLGTAITSQKSDSTGQAAEMGLNDSEKGIDTQGETFKEVLARVKAEREKVNK